MLIETENFKQKIINELTTLVEKNQSVWKSVSIDTDDFMTVAKYTETKNGGTKLIPIAYRVCKVGNTAHIIVYDYSYKKGPTDTSELPSVEVCDKTIKGSKIYDLLLKIKAKLEEDTKAKDEVLLDKLTWYLNSKK